MWQSLVVVPVLLYFTSHTAAQVTDFIPWDSLTQYQLLGSCPQTYLNRVANSQFSSYLCPTTQRTAECVCEVDYSEYRRTDVAVKISSVISAGCTVYGEASSATDVFYEWCTSNVAAAVASDYGIPVPPGGTTSTPPRSALPVLTLRKVRWLTYANFLVPASNPAIPTSNPPGSDSSTNPANPPAKNNDDAASLSAGDIAGIVVAIAIFLLTIICTVFLERRRRAATSSHYSWMSRVDHVYFVAVNRAAKPFVRHASHSKHNPVSQPPEEGRSMRQLEGREEPLALEMRGQRPG
ncbi:MAG: hypothetical protein Q9166_005358 [cf. Caloplaca sp. 2 TL-2023]